MILADQAAHHVHSDLTKQDRCAPGHTPLRQQQRRRRNGALITTLAVLGVTLAGCETLPTEPEPVAEPVAQAPAEPPPPSPPPPYQVRYGDTLSTIAAALGIDYLALAEINGLEPPYAIYEGQVLSTALDGMTPEQIAAVEDARRAMIARANEEVIRTAEAERQALSVASEGSVASKGSDASEAVANTIVAERPAAGVWQWPATGPIVAEFSGANQKGIDIAGERSAPIYAAADGVVQHVYDDAPQYGRLLIINHGEQYLGFYGHTDKVLVQVGDNVTRGQVIAEMGDSGTDSVKLHFQLRKNAIPIDPRTTLPEL